VASLVSEQPAGNEPPQTPQVEAAQAAAIAPVSIENETTAHDVAREFSVNAPRVSAPMAEISDPAAETEPAVPPQSIQLETAQDTPAIIDESTAVATVEEPALETVTAPQPEIPVADDDAVIATQPASSLAEVADIDAPAVAGIAEDAQVEVAPDVADIVTEPEAPEVTAADEPEIVVPTVEERTAEALSADELEAEAPTAEEPAASGVATAEEPAAPEVTQSAPQTLLIEPTPIETPVEATPKIAEIVEPDPISEPESIPAAAPQEEPIVEAQTPAAVVISEAPDAPSATEEAPTTPAPAQQPNANRVLRLGGSTSVETQDVATDTAENAEEETPQTALHRYGTPFENAGDVAMLSVLLVDDGSLGVMATRIAGLGLPVTVVLDAFDPNAHDRMVAYQAAGIEVAIQLSLPVGAVPTDIEVAFESVFGLLPEAIILYAGEGGVLRNNRAATAQVMQVLAADGRGLITGQRGLSGALQAAVDAGVPAAGIMRDIDGAGETADVIKRGLDQAALRARQTGDVVLLGRVHDATLTALADWAGGVNQSQLALAPVSAVLLDVMP
jgi:polysaccharide deacetylase 2 family uncharacterized protein YibQ